ncbi:MAG: protein kinase domain-containing protein [Betaproteobacteria bacterium]
MPQTAGTRLGTCEIVAPLGAGGMGEVYRARDTTLERDVALKILPEAFVGDPDRLARFEREARTLAVLNHPHIAQIYSLEDDRGIRFLTMELVEGETLASRLAKGPLAIDEALTIASQIADALAAAHEKGIVHRDLKPANVAVTSAGAVKVLDFGLAKAAGGSAPTTLSPTNLAYSPTVMSPVMTGAGVILGTAAYMAPEQARGREVDRRADVWAFGCVLFEMLTGRQREIAYVAKTGGGRTLYLRRADRLAPVEVNGTLGVWEAFFSPDGQWIGFIAADRLMKVAVTGGRPVPVAATPNFNSGVWADDGTIYVGGRAGLAKVSPTGTLTMLVKPAANEGQLSEPDLLPTARCCSRSSRTTSRRSTMHRSPC